jgi:hypothetical protein
MAKDFDSMEDSNRSANPSIHGRGRGRRWEMSGVDPEEGDPQARPAPDDAFDQRIAW